MKEKSNNQKTLVLLDTHALIYRAFHALPPLTSPKGEPVGAVYGVANVLLKILKEFKPDYIASAFDRPEPTFRHKQYKEYKAQRAEAPDDLISQFDSVRDLFEAFGVRSYDKAGYEADDIIGTLVNQVRAGDKNSKIIIISGDLDIWQLVKGDRVVVCTMRKGVNDMALYDEQAVAERFGFLPKHIPDFKGLKGDPSDNIKGVPGIGDKTATTLIQEFGTLENLYTALAKKTHIASVLKGRLPALLEAHREDAFFSRDLARIRLNAPIKLQLADISWQGVANMPRALAFLERVGFASMVARISGIENKSVPEKQPALIEEQPSVTAEFLNHARKNDVISWIIRAEERVELVAGKETALVKAKDISNHADKFSQLFHGNTIHIMQGGKEVLKELWEHAVPEARVDFDIGIASWVLDPTLREPDITQLLAGKDVTHTPPLAGMLKKSLKKNKLENIYFDFELPLVPILARMERTGILLDGTALKKFSKKLSNILTRREDHIYKLAGTKFNINSPKQLSEVLFGTLGISSEHVRKTGGGARSTRASELTKLRGAHAVIDELIAYREEMKLKTTYVDVLPQLARPDTGRIHATFNQTGTVTGRLSSQNPNMQNIPARTPLGQEIRRAFVAEEGFTLLSCDYSQIELRLAASLSKDEHMIAAFHGGADIHTLTASAVNHVSSEQVTSGMRREAKTINFGILYGMGAMSLSESLGITRKEADSFIREYFAQFPRVKIYLEKIKKQAHKDGYVETFFGRRRYFNNLGNLGWQARREQERMAINAPIQGSGADIIKRAMIHVTNSFVDQFLRDDLRLLLQVHDELLFEVRINALEDLCRRIPPVMESVCELAVPLKVDIKTGGNWQDMA